MSLDNALTAKLDWQNWTFYVGTVVLSINTMFKPELGCSSAELVYFQSLRLPGDFFLANPSEEPFPESLIGEMKRFAANIHPAPTRVKQAKRVYMPRELKTCSHIFVKLDPIKPNLTPAYAGPYFVISHTDKTFKVLKNDRILKLAVNNVKPCFELKKIEDISDSSPIFGESENDSTQPTVDNNTFSGDEFLHNLPTSDNSPNNFSDRSHRSTYLHPRIRRRPKHFDDFESSKCMFNAFA